ncbi:DUF2332 domain-containing protein [Shimia ponticola]|uniref:DUF2332 domain-containing protein n=1 Tax=Shimia ponticola TaxID=2582893 RepID=UPI0011BF7667|nr:DUF2332 family protein [Shimia ponticola]
MTPALTSAFAGQAKACGQLDSPFMAWALPLMLDAVDPASALGTRLCSWPEDRIRAEHDAVALRLAGGLHALKLQGDATLAAVYPPNTPDEDTFTAALRDTYARHEATLLDWLNLPPQTNEVRRAAILIAAGHWLTARYGKMLVVSELGASGGLNLNWDFFHMQVGDQSFGPETSAVRLTPEWQGTPPTHCPPYVHEARGVDLNPLNPTDPKSELRLMAYLWPDQAERLARTKAAIALAKAPGTESEHQLQQGDALEWLPTRLPHRAPYLHMIYSTIAWQYLPDAARAAGTAMIETAGAQATADTPLAWFTMEPDGKTPGAAMTMRLWPGDLTLNFGRVDFHGRSVNWQAPPP